MQDSFKFIEETEVTSMNDWYSWMLKMSMNVKSAGLRDHLIMLI